MNDIQSAPVEKHGNIFVTLNPPFPPSAKHVFGHYAFMHPVQSPEAVRARLRVAELNSHATESGRHRAFAGAWASHGFHEHGFTAGLRAAAALPGVALPFRIADADEEYGVPRTGVVADVFDALDVVRSYVVLIINLKTILLFVAWQVWKKVV
jgi:predicted NAD/FAD-binding protein